MKESYSIDEILNAINDLQNLKKEKKFNLVTTNKNKIIIKSDIPSNTLQLIEEAENTIKSKSRSE